MSAERILGVAPASPSAAKTAAKEKMVMGFVSVRKNVEVYMPACRFFFLNIEHKLFLSGFSMNVLIPRKHRNAPPASLIQNW